MMDFNKRTYEMAENPPSTIHWEEYENGLLDNYHKLLEQYSNDEKVFQKFFEQFPSFVPGSFELIGTSGHYPYLNCLISEPEIGGVFTRKPDFVWLAQDSLTFCPVLIEIEKPGKRTFNGDGIPSADINQALDQIREWKMIINEPTNRHLFYEFFEVPDYMRKKHFEPQFGLIYGRRSEYEGNRFLTQKRANMQSPDTVIMSYDRLHPHHDCRELMCAKIKASKVSPRYHIISIPATYTYSPYTSEILNNVSDFFETIDKMQYTTPERKKFLKERYGYWIEYGKLKDKGIINTGDRE